MAKGAAVIETKDEQPVKGGSYMRNEDGLLVRDEVNSTAAAETKAETYPKEKGKGE